MNDNRLAPSREPPSPTSPSLRPLAAGIGAVQQLRETLEKFQEESASLLRGASSLEDFLQQQERRYAELEQELNDTALLYVSSYQMNARRDPKEVLRQIRELLEQLAGVESFAVYIAADDADALYPVSSRSIPLSELTPLLPRQRPLDVVSSGRCAMIGDQTPLRAGSVSAPLAVIPLQLGDRMVGAILVIKLFEHKTRWAQVDQQLFQLLASHGASALFAAHLYQRYSHLPGALAGLGESLK